MKNRSTHLSTWVSADLKERFATAAVLRGLSESALLKRLVEQMLAGAGSEITPLQRPALLARDVRVTVRLVPEDRLLLAERAVARGMPAASYVSSLVRSYLRSLAPLPNRELEALRSAVAQFSDTGRNLNAIRHAALAGGAAAAPTQMHVLQMLRVCEAVRQ